MPRFTCILSKDNQSVSHRSKILNAPLPTDRSLFAGGGSADAPLAYKDYFQAARIFLEQNHWSVLTESLAVRLQRPVCPEEILEVRASLEKHGQFYHPSRIEAIGCGFKAAFVLNVAVSPAGKEWIETEYDTIRKLNKDYTGGYLPEVYAFGEVPIKSSGCDICLPMFLGEWFEGFNEFHLSFDPETGKSRLIVWDHRQGSFFLSPAQAVKLFKEASRILTFYYNPKTFEQIFSWHHAAGDFVLKIEKKRVCVRLVAARNYQKLFKYSERVDRKGTLALQALLIFFLHLSIRMRLDRLDGTGSVVWLGQEALIGVVEGFLEALAQKPRLHTLPVALTDGFKAVISVLTQRDLLGLLRDIVATYPPAGPDNQTINAHLEGHAADLFRLMQTGKI